MSFGCGRAFSAPISRRRALGSRNAAGSSSSSVVGSAASTAATAASRFSPPESRSGERSARRSMPSRASVSSVRRSISAREKPKLRGPKATSSRMVGMKSWSSGFWNTRPTRRRTSPTVFGVRRMPSARTAPRAAGSTPTAASISVVLPAPFAPSRAALPRSSEKVTPSSASVPSG